MLFHQRLTIQTVASRSLLTFALIVSVACSAARSPALPNPTQTATALSSPPTALPATTVPTVAATATLDPTSTPLVITLTPTPLTSSGSQPPLPKSPTSTPVAIASPLVVLPTNADIAIASERVVWVRIGGVSGNLLFRSQDQGATWQQRHPPPTDGISDGPSFVDASLGWDLVAGSPATQCTYQSVQIWQSSDGAASWQNLGAIGIQGGQCKYGLTFVDAKHGFLSASDPNGRPTIYRTDNGGTSWLPSAPLPDPPNQTTQAGGFSLRPRRVQGFGTDLLVSAVGWLHLYVYRSTDGGASWAYLATVPGVTDVDEISFLDPRNWWVSGPGLGPNYRITSDAGASYGMAPGAPPSAAPIAPVFSFADRSVGFATVRGQIWKTTDGGTHWSTIPTPGT